MAWDDVVETQNPIAATATEISMMMTPAAGRKGAVCSTIKTQR